MTHKDFLQKSKEIIATYTNDKASKSTPTNITADDVILVNTCYILGNMKAFLTTMLPDGMYFETVYNAQTGDIYVDAYKKWENFSVRE